MDFRDRASIEQRAFEEELLNGFGSVPTFPNGTDFHSTGDLTIQFHQLSHQVADFIALQETCLEQIQTREAAREQQFQSYCQNLNQQLYDINTVLNDFKTIMTQAGVARWRIAAEETLAQGQAHLTLLQTQAQHFQNMLELGTDRIDKVTKLAEVRISRVVRSFRLEYFKYLIEHSSQQMQNASQSAISKISSTIRWFHWEKFGIAILVGLVVAVVLGLFVTDEWPWESHNQVANERQAGRLLMQAWPDLSELQKEQLQLAITHHHKKEPHG